MAVQQVAVLRDGVLLLDVRGKGPRRDLNLKLLLALVTHNIGSVGMIQTSTDMVHELAIDGRSLSILPCVTLHPGMESIFPELATAVGKLNQLPSVSDMSLQTSVVLHTTSQSLGALLKSARDIMRKDKGLNGDLDRLPMLTWIMFLKFLDDLELQREEETKLAGKKFKPAVEPPYRWRDWAANPQGLTGDELLAFINNEKTSLPNGKEGAGLFRYLRTLTSSNGDNRRDVIATVFKGVQNRMVSGYLLRDVINKIAGIHFTSSGELHTLGALYESMLREMRDAAGDSGEFYTPRAVVRFMVTRNRSAPGRVGARSRVRHRRVPGRGLQSSEQASQDSGRPHSPAGEISSPVVNRNHCRSCWRK